MPNYYVNKLFITGKAAEVQKIYTALQSCDLESQHDSDSRKQAIEAFIGKDPTYYGYENVKKEQLIKNKYRPDEEGIFLVYYTARVEAQHFCNTLYRTLNYQVRIHNAWESCEANEAGITCYNERGEIVVHEEYFIDHD